MPSSSGDQARAEHESINCMEVWGGSGVTNNYIQRPGMDLWIWSQSHRREAAGGGDLHLFSSCASGRITRALLADICGFGSLFAEISAELRDLMKRNVNSIQQTRVVRQMSSRLDDVSRRGGFASTLVSTYFAPSRSYTLCNAGQPPPLLYRAQVREWSILKQRSAQTLSSPCSPGVVHPEEYQQFKTKLALGDMVLSYSNTLTECRDSKGRTIGLAGILDRVRHMHVDAPSQLAGSLIEQLRGEHDNNLAVDDATLLLCQATDTPVAWRDNLLAPLRLLRSVSDKTKIA